MARLLSHMFILYFLLFANEILSLSNFVVRDVEPDDTILPGRRLRAAKRSHELGARDVEGCLRYDHNMHYLDADTHGSTSQFAAKVGMNFKIPALMLEDVEHHIESVGCYSSEIHLHFRSAELLKRAHNEFARVNNFLLVTSHRGCNEDGERNPHVVSEAAVDLDSQVIALSILRVPWKNTFNSMTLNFGKSDDEFVLRQHSRLASRQAAATSSAVAASSIEYPSAPSSTPSNWNASANFSKQWLDTSILPADTSLGHLSLSSPKLPPNFKIKCKNCTVEGNIDLVAGSLTVGGINHASSNTSQGILNLTESIIDFVEHGYVQFKSNSFGAHIELESAVTASETLYNYTAPLPTIPLTPFQIPGIASVGPELVPRVFVGFKLAASIDFFYGLEVQIPNDSSVLLDLQNTTNSTQSGFSNTTVTALPFQASLPNLALTATAGFQPQLLLGISFFNGKGTAGAGIFLDAPLLTSTLSTLNHVTAKCENASTTTTITDTGKEIIFDALTHVDASVDVGLGLTAEAEVDVVDVAFKDAAPYSLLRTSYALPTACLSFDEGAKRYGAATASPSPSATSTATKGHDGGKSGGAVGVVNPFGAQGEGLRGMMVVSGLMVVGSVFSMLL